jgi:type II secretion system protein N
MMSPGWPRKKVAPVAAGRKSAWQRSGLFLLGAAALFLLAFFVGIHLFFPTETLKQRLSFEAAMQTGAEVRIESVALSPVLTLAASGVNLTTKDLPWRFEIDDLRVTPRWLTLFSGDPGAQIQALMMNGTLTLNFRKSGAFTAQAAGLSFDLPVSAPLTCRVAGTLGAADLTSKTRLDADTQTHLSLRLSEVRILGLELSGGGGTDLEIGEITLRADGQGRSMQINSLAAKGGDFDLDGEGTLMVGHTADSSRLRLTLTIRPGPNLDSSISSLLELAGEPDSDGRYTLQVTGSLSRPLLKLGG